MPEYHVSHAIPLTIPQKDELAKAITELHVTTFDTPKLWVYVYYTDVSQVDSYRAGKPFKESRVQGTIRNGPTRTREDFIGLAKAISQAWDKIVGNMTVLPNGTATSMQNKDTTLTACVLVGDILGGIEAGFVVPAAGKDREWLKENMQYFQQRADEGEGLVQDMIQDIKSRGMV